jgi:nucleoside-diphosphate-sugar epimerase
MILVTGGTGVMGMRLVDKLLTSGNQIRVLALPGDPAVEKMINWNIDISYGDITDFNSLKNVCLDVDTVYHLAAIILSPLNQDLFWKINYHGTKNLIQAAENSGVRHFIYISSASVTYPITNEYARSKKGAEELLIHSRIPHYTIVRPTLAYEDGGAAEIVHFINYLKKYPVIPFIGSGNVLKSPVYVEDIIEGFVTIHGNEKAYSRIYNFSGGEQLTLKEMARRLLEHMGKRKMFVHIPVTVCRLLAFLSLLISRLSKKEPLLTYQTITGVTQHANLDNSTAVEDLHYHPRPFSEGIKELKTIKNCLVEPKVIVNDSSSSRHISIND